MEPLAERKLSLNLGLLQLKLNGGICDSARGTGAMTRGKTEPHKRCQIRMKARRQRSSLAVPPCLTHSMFCYIVVISGVLRCWETNDNPVPNWVINGPIGFSIMVG